MKSGGTIYSCFCLFFIFLSLLFSLVATYTPHWIDRYDYYFDGIDTSYQAVGSFGFLMSCRKTCFLDGETTLRYIICANNQCYWACS